MSSNLVKKRKVIDVNCANPHIQNFTNIVERHFHNHTVKLPTGFKNNIGMLIYEIEIKYDDSTDMYCLCSTKCSYRGKEEKEWKIAYYHANLKEAIIGFINRCNDMQLCENCPKIIACPSKFGTLCEH